MMFVYDIIYMWGFGWGFGGGLGAGSRGMGAKKVCKVLDYVVCLRSESPECNSI